MRTLLALPLLLTACATGAEPTISPDTTPAPAPAPIAPDDQGAPPVEFIEAKPTKAPGALPTVTVKSLAKKQVIEADKAADLEIKFAVQNWKLDPKSGKALHFILDNQRIFRVTDPKATLKLGQLNNNKPLEEGQHLLAVLPVHPNGESIKPVGKRSPAAIIPFYVGKKAEPAWDDKAPLLVVNGPLPGKINGDVVVDFFPVNIELAKGKAVIHASVSGPDLAKGESISALKPWIIKNARPGEYIARIELFQFVPDSFESGSAVSVNIVSKRVPGLWYGSTREFILD